MLGFIIDHLMLFASFFLTGVAFGFFFGYVVVTSTEKRL